PKHSHSAGAETLTGGDADRLSEAEPGGWAVRMKNFQNSRTKAPARGSQSMERSIPKADPEPDRRFHDGRFGPLRVPGLIRGGPAEPRGCRATSPTIFSTSPRLCFDERTCRQGPFPKEFPCPYGDIPWRSTER